MYHLGKIKILSCPRIISHKDKAYNEMRSLANLFSNYYFVVAVLFGFFFYIQGLTVQIRLAWNLQSSAYLPTSTSQVLRVEACTTTPQPADLF